MGSIRDRLKEIADSGSTTPISAQKAYKSAGTMNPGRLYSGKKEEEDGLDTASARARQLVQARRAAMERANARAQEIREKRTVRDLGTGSAREERLQTSQQAAASRLHAENRRANAGFTTFARGNAVTQTSEMDTGRALAEGLNRSGMDMQTRGEAAAESQRRASELQKQLTNQEKVLQNVYDAYMKAPSEELYNGYQNLYKRYENTKQAYALYAEKYQKDAQEYREAEKFYTLMQQEAEKQQRKQDAEMGVETGEDGKRRIVDFEKYNAAAGINPETLYTGADARAADEALEPYAKQLEYWQRNGTKDRKTQQAVQNSMNALKDAYIDNPQATTAQRDKARQLLAQMDALENIGNADALTYTAAQLPLGMEGQIRGVTSLAGTAIGDLATGGKTSDDFKALTDFLAANPAYEKLVFESGTAADFVARKAGVSPASVKAYREANVNAYNTQKVSDYYEGVSDTYKETAGRMAYSVGQQLPSMLLTMGGGEMIGSISQRAASGAITEAAAKAQMAAVEALSKSISVGLMSVGAAGNTLTERANESGYSLANYAYAAATGATEAATEYMLGTTGDVASYQLKVRGVRELFQNALEEGIEEMLGYPIESAADWLFASSKSVDEWVDKITKNSVLDKMSVKEWLQSGIEGFAVGGLMGVSGLVLNSDSGDYDSTGFDRRIKGYAGRESVDYFADMADMEQLNARYEQLRAVYGTQGTDPDTRKMARINNQYISRVGYTAMRAYMEKNGIDMTPAREKLVPVEQKKSASGMETQETTAINTDPAEHTAAEQRVIKAYKEAADEGLVQFVEDSVKNKGANQGRYTLNPVSDRAARDIERLTGVNTTGFRTVIEQRMAEHIYDEHGPNGTTDQSMADINDIGRMQYVLDNYDDIRYGGRSGAYSTNKGNGRTRQADTVVFAKAVNGTYYVVEAVPDTARKTTYVVSAYMSKEGIKNTGASETADVKTPAYTAKTDSMSSPVSTMVPQGESGVKGNYARAAEENTEVRAENAQTTAQAEPVTLIPDTQAARMTEKRGENMQRAAKLRQRVADAEAEIASPYELGVKNGEKEAQNRVIPESIARRDAAMQEARKILKDAGYPDTGFVTGQIERYGGTDHFALTQSGKVLIQADSVWNTPQDIARAFVRENGKGEVNHEIERKEQVSLYDRNAGRRGNEPGRERAERVPAAERLRGGTREHREAADQRRRAAAEQPAVSPEEAGVPLGSAARSCRIQPESTWDAEQNAAAEYAYSKGAKTVVYLTGDVQVEYEGATEGIDGAWDAETGTLYVRADSLSRSVSETVEHEVVHAIITLGNVERFMTLVKQKKTAAWSALYAAYEKRYRSFTEGMPAKVKGIYIWEEILADAYSETNRYGTRAGTFAAQADEAMAGAGEVQAGERGRKFSFGKLKDADVRAQAEEMDFDAEARYNERTNEGGVSYDREMGDDTRGRVSAQMPGKQGAAGAGQYRTAEADVPEEGRAAGNAGQNVLRSDSEGRRLTAEQAQRLQGTAITDETGAPRAVYHFTPETEFETFEKGDIGFHFGTKGQAMQRGKDMKAEDGRMFRAYLNIKNPYHVRLDLNTWWPSHIGLYMYCEGVLTDAQWEEIQSLDGRGYDTPGAKRLREMLDEKGIDGFVYPNMVEGSGDSYIALYDEQIVRSEIQPVKGKFSASDTTADPVPEYLHEMDEALRENSAVNYTPGTLETLLEKKGLTAEEIEASGIMDIAEDARHQTGRPVGTIDAEALKEYVRIKMNAYRKYTETGIHPATETELRDAELKARRKLRSELLGLFPVQQQNRAEVSKALEDFANWYMSGGERIDKDALWTHEMALFDTMWKSAREMDESGAEVYGPAATMMKGMKLDVPESVRADFGDDWGDVRRALFGVGIYTTKKGLPLDSAYAELSAVHPGFFDEHELDGKAQLEKILEIAQEARPKAMTLEETAQRNGVDVDAMMSEYLMGTTVAIGDYMTALDDMRESWKTGVPTGMSIDDYLEYRDRSAREDAQERAKTIARENFRATPAMDRLGIRIDNSVTDYGQAMALKELNRARRQAERKAQKEAERRGATRAERQAARAIARGDMRLTDYRFGGQLKQETVKALSELYAAVESFNADAIAAHKRGVKEQLREQMGKLIGKQLPRKKLGMAAMNYMTPKRIMAELFGDAGGKQVYDEVFRSVARNGGEMIRWVQGQKDKVKRFEGADGKARKLSAGESRIVQMMMEGRGARDSAAKLHESVRDNILNAAADIYGKLRALNENKRSYKKAAQAAMDDARAEYGLNADELRLAYQASRMNEAETLVKELGLDAVKLQNAANTYREMFDGYYDAINDFLVVHGYEPIGFVKGYTPHMQSEESLGALTKALQLLGGTEDVSSLPVDIAGLTQDFKPGKKYDPYFLQRTGVLSSYDIQAAFDSYLDYLGQVFFRTDDIMRVRALSSYIRENYAPESLRDILDWDASLGEMPAEVKRDWLEEQGAIARDSQMTDEEVNEKFDEYREQITEDAAKNSQYGNLVMWLDNYANILAGKQSAADRGNEQLLGRRTANIANKMTGMTGAALVGANMSSVLNQTSQLAFILGENRTSSVVKALGDMMTRRTRGWDVQSDFLAGKDGVDLLAKDTKGMIDESLFSILTLSDRLVATLAVRTRYIEEIRKGADAETAMDRADDWARDMMGSRMKGERPLAFESKRPLVRAVNMFQTEVLNSWEHVALDLPQEIRDIERTKGRKKAALAAANLIIKTLISAFVMNRLADELYGGTPAMFDVIGLSGLFVASGQGMTENDWIRKVIDNGLENLGAERIFGTAREGEKEFDWKAAREDTFYNITNDLPLVRNVAGLLGWGDETLPTMQLDELLDYVRDMIAGATEGNLRGVTDSAVGLLSNVIPGGRQLQKTYQGARIMAEGGRYKGKDDSLQLMYPVDATVTDWIRALLFGRAGVDAEGEYWASGEKALSTGQTELYREMVGKGADGQEVYSVILDWRAAANDKELDSTERGKREREALKQADLTDGEKLEMYRGLANADSRSEDFRKIMDTGVSFNRTMEIYDAYKALYDREDMTAGEKATEFAVWLDGQDYDTAQKTEIRDVLKYYSMVPAEAGRYDKLTDAGLGVEAAERMTKALAALEPEEGKENVSVRQQYRAVLDSDLSDGDKAAAIGTLMDSTDEYTEKGELSQWGKFKKVLDSGLTLEDWYDMYTEEQLDNFCRYMDEGISGEAAMQTAEALDELKDQYEGTDENPKDIEKWRAIALQPYDEFTKSIVLEKMMDEGTYAKYRGARDAGMSTWQYVDFKDQVSYLEADKDANGKTIRNSLKNKVVALIDSMDISGEAKDYLYLNIQKYAKSGLGSTPWH